MTESGPALALSVLGANSAPPLATASSPADRVRDALAGLDWPVPVQQLRKLCAMRTATLWDSLAELTRQGLVVREAGGYQLGLRLDPGSSAPAFPVTHPRDPQGNGNGKHPAPS